MLRWSINIIRTISEITYEIKDGKALKTKKVFVLTISNMQFSTEERYLQHFVPNNNMSAFSDCSAENEQNMNILKTNIPDMDILLNSLLDFIFFKYVSYVSLYYREGRIKLSKLQIDYCLYT